MGEVVEMRGITECIFRRWSTRYEAVGVEGLEDRRIGRATARAVPVDKVLRMVTLYESRYTGWTVERFHKRWHLGMVGCTRIRGRRSGSKRRARSRVRRSAECIARNAPTNRCRGGCSIKTACL